MIYSSIMFFNEIDLIDLRIEEESPYVDKIFIAESPMTFTGNAKPLNFPIERHKDNEKVVYLVVPHSAYIGCNIAWDREHVQRNYAQTIVPFNDDDIWFVTDTDEVLIGEKLPGLVKVVRQHGLVGLHMPSYSYYINAKCNRDWFHPFAAIGSICKKYTFDNLRNRVRINSYNMPNCGKHFCNLGGAEAIEYKLKSFSHVEHNTPAYLSRLVGQLNNICKSNGLTVVNVDNSYPKTILNNLANWGKHIKR